MNTQLLDRAGLTLNANGLPYSLPVHPNLVHLTLGLFIIAFAFDVAATLFPLEKPIFKFLALTALRKGFYDVGWYNLLTASMITFFTVGAGFFEILLANPSADVTGTWGLSAGATMLLHGLGGVLLLALIVAVTVWRGFQRYYWRSDRPRQVQWSYLLACLVILGIMFAQGTLGAQMGSQFGIHTTAADLLRQGKSPNVLLK